MINTKTQFGKNLLFAGNLMSSEFLILGIVVIGVIFAWGFATAARKGTQQIAEPDEEGDLQ